jgi:hypothetical protein
LRIGDWLGLFALGRFVSLADDLVHVAHTDLDGVGGSLLQIGVE